jgi:hypothetical protein
MIITHLVGGLGNQLFQYALGYALAKKNNDVAKLDLESYAAYRLHKYSLDAFNVSLQKATTQEIDELKYPTQKNGPLGFVLRRRKKYFGKNYVAEKQQDFDPAILSLTGDMYLQGYWQSEKYFAHCAEDIRHEFTVKHQPQGENKEVADIIGANNAVAIHIRHGDYLKNPAAKAYHGVLPLKYYQRAIDVIRQKTQEPSFFVFSDDIPWAKEHLSNIGDVYFVDHNDAAHNYEDIRLMAMCQHQIIANSTFSWWGAWLNENPNKIVISPKQWFNNHTRQDLVPDTWLKI